MKVSLVGMSSFGYEGSSEDVIYTALSQCYNEHYDIGMVQKDSQKKKKAIIKKVLESGHESVSESVSFTFLLEDISRTASHQIVRHRLSSFSQRSARYTSVEDGQWYVTPHTIEGNPEALKIYEELMEKEKEAYLKLRELNIPKEDSRFVLGNCQRTNLVMTANCRSLKNFFGLRLCTRAQWEIREIAEEMAKICRDKLPVVFEDCKWGYAKCIQNSFCNEENCCGLMSTLKELKDVK